MKVKKLALFLAGILSVATLSACIDDDKRVVWTPYWQFNALTEGEAVDETLTYTVTYAEDTGVDSLSYTLAYGTGSYIARLKKESNLEYVYTTELTIPVTYTFNEETQIFTDKVTTTVTFKSASDALLPKSSTKTVISHTPSPSTTTVNELADCYSDFDYTVTTEYKEKGTATVVNHKQETTDDSQFTYDKGDYSYLDNDQLLLALRAIATDTTSGKIEFYNPFLEATQKVNFSFGEKTSTDFSHSVGDDAAIKTISYRPVTITLDSKTPGATQTAWIATADDVTKNTYRNVMLYLETPLSYSLGTLKYTLTSAVYA